MTRPVTATVLLAMVVLAAAATTPWTASTPELPAILPSNPARFPSAPAQPTTAATAPPTDVLDDTSRDILAIVAIILLVALLAWIGVALGRRLQDRYAPEPETPRTTTTGEPAVTAAPDVVTAQLKDRVQQALTAVDQARAVPRDAVVAAWVALEDAAAAHGTTRDPAHTPTEFTTAVLAATPAPAADIATLRGLYQRARFTSHPVTDDDVTTARRALSGIAHALDPAGTP